jgi:hypothetical protein
VTTAGLGLALLVIGIATIALTAWETLGWLLVIVGCVVTLIALVRRV